MKKRKLPIGEKGLGEFRAYSPQAEGKFRALYSGLSQTKMYMDRVLTNALKTHLAKQYRNPAEMEALLKITGMLESLKRNRVWTASKEQSAQWFKEAEAMRYDKKFGLSKEDAMTRFVLGQQPKSISLGKRPIEMMAKKGTPYKARPGSSAGKIKTTQRGAVQVQKEIANLIRSIFSIGGKKPRIGVTRSFSKTFNIKE